MARTSFADCCEDSYSKIEYPGWEPLSRNGGGDIDSADYSLDVSSRYSKLQPYDPLLD